MYALTEEQIDDVAGGWVIVAAAAIGAVATGVAAYFGYKAATADSTTTESYEKCDYQLSNGDQYGCSPSTKDQATRIRTKKVSS